jgi:hypothetical protein
MEEVLVPLQEYFLNRRTNPKDYPKYIGIRIMQEDASLYDNVLECCPRGCAHVVAKDAVSEGRTEEYSRQPLAETSKRTFEHISEESHGENSSVSAESPFDTHPQGSDNRDAREDGPSTEDSSESGVWIMGNGDSG